MNLVVNAIDDANCVSAYFSPCTIPCFQSDSFMIDYGKNTPQTLGQFLHHKHFFLSHFHKDHYGGLYNILDLKSNITQFCNLEKIYYPTIPEFKDTNVKNELKKFVILGLVLGDDSGSPAQDFITLLQKITKKCRLDSRGLNSESDPIKISDKQIEVIWPPKVADRNTEKSMANAIEKLRGLIKSDKELEKVWARIEKLEVDNDDFFHIGQFDPPVHNNIINADIKKAVICKIRNITNSLSLCLYIEDELLFLGDLNKYNIKRCLSLLLKNKQKTIIKVKYFITPHHGTFTHFNNILKNIEADYVISSNGTETAKRFCDEYKHIGKFFHNTYQQGDFMNFKMPFSDIIEHLWEMDQPTEIISFGSLVNYDGKIKPGYFITFSPVGNCKKCYEVTSLNDVNDQEINKGKEIIVHNKSLMTCKIYVSECGDKNVAVMYKQ